MTTRVAVLGAGTMGHGIAYVAALAGCEVRLTDAKPEALPRALEKIDGLLAGGVERGKITAEDRTAIRSRLRQEPRLRTAVSSADVVIEAVAEDLGVKQRLFEEVERHAPRGALLASNTPSPSIGAIASALTQPARLIGIHFFNPVHVMKLVEVVTHAPDSISAADRAVAFARRLGKE